jgi:voltage-gated potassium channel
MKNLKSIIENSDSKKSKPFNIFIQLMIIVSLISFSIETFPDLSSTTNNILWIIEIITVVIFTIEYLLRIIIADKPLKFIFSFFGLIDLLAILPFYIASGIDLRSIRIVRLLRLFRMFKLFRYSKAISHFRNAFLLIKHELILYFIATLFLLYISAVGIYYFENPIQPEHFKSIFHSMWWAVATLTTVGYGDIYPITIGGRIFTFFILIIGLGIIAVPSGLIASALTKTDDIDNY